MLELWQFRKKTLHEGVQTSQRSYGTLKRYWEPSEARRMLQSLSKCQDLSENVITSSSELSWCSQQKAEEEPMGWMSERNQLDTGRRWWPLRQEVWAYSREPSGAEVQIRNTKLWRKLTLYFCFNCSWWRRSELICVHLSPSQHKQPCLSACPPSPPKISCDIKMKAVGYTRFTHIKSWALMS